MEKQLQSILRQPDTVLFVGSGVSTWAGLPSWPRLIEELSEFLASKGHDPILVKREAERGELLQAASYGFDKLTRPQIGEFIRQTCRLGKAQPHEVHHKLVTLGPRCFVTTNYDRLLEASFQQWQPDRYYRMVTNRQLTETAEIVGARSTDFLFKPHGDVEDAESIILTREQYRALAPGGERHNALETMRILLASRPFVYVGFGFRDPDFLYVRDLLANTYKGRIRDHYAIMADVTAPEADYWRRNYGIHLITYPTLLCPDNSRDHKALIELLDRLNSRLFTPAVIVPPYSMEPDLPGTVLALARHAARLSRVEKPSLLFPLHVYTEKTPHVQRTVPNYRFGRYQGSPVESLLDNGPERLILTGHPGAGKSFAVRHSVARLAEQLHEHCLEETFDHNGVVVPIMADLKLYNGDTWSLLEKTLPAGLNLADLISRFRVKVYLDAFNEMPREYIENGEWEADFSRFLKRASQASIIVTSRTSDGLRKMDIPVFCIDEVNDAFVEAQLEKWGFITTGLFQQEILTLLQKPFFFQLILSGSLALPKGAQPRDIFNVFLARLTSDFQARFGIAFDVTRPLAALAHDAINQGVEAIPVATAIRVIQDQLAAAGMDSAIATDIVNWLVGRDFLLPFSGGRVAFFHQSITEYLAATELARNYAATPHVLRERLALRRWDQALFLTLSLLSGEQATKFIEAVIEIDFILALSAVKFMEFGRDDVVARLLVEIPKKMKTGGDLNSLIYFAMGPSFPVSLRHEPLLRTLIKQGDSEGGAAASLLFSLRGDEVRAEFLELIVENCDDYNFCGRIGAALRFSTSDNDIPQLVALADQVQKRLSAKEIEDYEGFASALGKMLDNLSPNIVCDAFFDRSKLLAEQEVKLSVLCSLLCHANYSAEALNISADLLLAGVDEAPFCIHSIAIFSDETANLNWSSFGEGHVMRLIQLILDEEQNDWVINGLRDLCLARPDLASSVRDTCMNTNGILRAALLYAIAADDHGPVFDALNDLCNFSPEQLAAEPIELLFDMELNWTGNENLFVSLLRLRNTMLAWNLLETIYTAPNASMGILDVGSIEWWLDWIKEVANTKEGRYFAFMLSCLFADRLRPEVRDAFVNEFNKQDSPYREVLARTILLARSDLSVNQLSEDAISFLLADLSSRKIPGDFEGHLLENAATEAFVIERLLPLLSNAEEPLRNNLAKVLQQVGKRHGRRYVAT